MSPPDEIGARGDVGGPFAIATGEIASFPPRGTREGVIAPGFARRGQDTALGSAI